MAPIFQPSLFDGAEHPSFDASLSGVERLHLDATSWVDLSRGWVRGSDRVFEDILRARSWDERTRWMYQRRVREPRLTSLWRDGAGAPLTPALLDDLRRVLSARYGVVFDSAGFNLYRGGEDSVAWHGDKILEEIEEPVIALVSFGEPRKFLLRPKGGGKSLAFQLGRGDLLVTGGTTQRVWEHCVPKVAHAGPRISVAFRHGLDPRAYAGKVSPRPGLTACTPPRPRRSPSAPPRSGSPDPPR